MKFEEFYENYLQYIDGMNKNPNGKLIPLLPDEAMHLFVGHVVLREHDNKKSRESMLKARGRSQC